MFEEVVGVACVAGVHLELPVEVEAVVQLGEDLDWLEVLVHCGVLLDLGVPFFEDLFVEEHRDVVELGWDGVGF